MNEVLSQLLQYEPDHLLHPHPPVSGLEQCRPRIYRRIETQAVSELTLLEEGKQEVLAEGFSLPVATDKWLAYFPLPRFAFLINGDGVSILQALAASVSDTEQYLDHPAARAFIHTLRMFNVIGPQTTVSYRPRMFSHRLDLYLTTLCNLRCVYCFSSAMDRQQTMSLDIARTAIDLVFRESAQMEGDSVTINFDASGESFMAFKSMKECVQYAREVAAQYGMKVYFCCGSNGVLNERHLEWAAANLSGIDISLDGISVIHDQQRQTLKGAPTFDKVVQTLDRIYELNIPFYKVRTTATAGSVHHLPELAEFLAERYPYLQAFHVEPMYTSKRSRETGWISPDAESFVKNYLAARQILAESGIPIRYDGCKPHTLNAYHCDPRGVKFGITPDGDVTACMEVQSREDPRWEYFYYGTYQGEDHTFQIDKEKLGLNFSRTVLDMAGCQSCFCKWHCSGECMARTLITGDSWLGPVRKNFRCIINQKLLLHYLLEQLGELDIEEVIC